MNKELFGQPYDESDPNWVVLAYLDRMYNDGKFIEAIESISDGVGLSVDGAYCHFPFMDSFYDDDRFKGVKFIYGYSVDGDDDEVIVSLDVCLSLINVASAKYIKNHPEDERVVKEVFDKTSERLGDANRM
ncbi:ribonuclease toxin immunity protein CdiI [Chromobacterium haemolyticum]|uniref:Ribonuclease toxin immunity protein CdiI n=1 Tax=Chromobacterium fluminis TaxID=3044269 RepID=A0ABX0KXQ4_9NEIS|nr:ribonuclease toxin immunity protein CdiI [Chromobacterium haemolyticum]NHR04294.1 ribonuclease toxin immunity protein CdiI [Chromobacterium haemolyticum]